MNSLLYLNRKLEIILKNYLDSDKYPKKALNTASEM